MSLILFNCSLPWPLWMYMAVKKQKREEQVWWHQAQLQGSWQWPGCVAGNVTRTPLMWKGNRFHRRMQVWKQEGFCSHSSPLKEFPTLKRFMSWLEWRKLTENKLLVLRGYHRSSLFLSFTPLERNSIIFDSIIFDSWPPNW